MTSMVVSEARHLAALGEIIGRTGDAKALRMHADALSASLATNLLRGIYMQHL